MHYPPNRRFYCSEEKLVLAQDEDYEENDPEDEESFSVKQAIGPRKVFLGFDKQRKNVYSSAEVIKKSRAREVSYFLNSRYLFTFTLVYKTTRAYSRVLFAASGQVQINFRLLPSGDVDLSTEF